MRKGTLTISIDLELAWGVWDILTPEDLRRAEADERPICAALIDLFDRHQVPVTWAMVAALLDEKSARGRPGGTACWYAPDIVERIVNAKVAHEIGSHGGRHVYFANIAEPEAREDLAFAADVHRSNGLAFESFVFPRNAIGHMDLVAEAGLRTFRGPDAGWTRLMRGAPRPIRQAVNLADKMLPVPPHPVTARSRAAVDRYPGLHAAARTQRSAAFRASGGDPGKADDGPRARPAGGRNVPFLVPPVELLLPPRRAARDAGMVSRACGGGGQPGAYRDPHHGGPCGRRTAGSPRGRAGGRVNAEPELSPAGEYTLVPAMTVDSDTLVRFAAAAWPDRPPHEQVLSTWWRRADPVCEAAAVEAATGAMAALCTVRPAAWMIAGQQVPASALQLASWREFGRTAFGIDFAQYFPAADFSDGVLAPCTTRKSSASSASTRSRRSCSPNTWSAT